MKFLTRVVVGFLYLLAILHINILESNFFLPLPCNFVFIDTGTFFLRNFIKIIRKFTQITAAICELGVLLDVCAANRA
jgi:hypothetical protein